VKREEGMSEEREIRREDELRREEDVIVQFFAASWRWW
jgi:hypothetical protein